MLASVYVDDFERGNAMGIALGGLALGVLSKENNRVHINSISRAVLASTHSIHLPGSAPSWQHPTSMAGLSSSLPLLTLHSHCLQDLTPFHHHLSGDPETATTAGAGCCCPGTGDGGTATV